MIKKLSSIFVSLVIVFSLALTVYADPLSGSGGGGNQRPTGGSNSTRYLNTYVFMSPAEWESVYDSIGATPAKVQIDGEWVSVTSSDCGSWVGVYCTISIGGENVVLVPTRWSSGANYLYYYSNGSSWDNSGSNTYNPGCYGDGLFRWRYGPGSSKHKKSSFDYKSYSTGRDNFRYYLVVNGHGPALCELVAQEPTLSWRSESATVNNDNPPLKHNGIEVYTLAERGFMKIETEETSGKYYRLINILYPDGSTYHVQDPLVPRSISYDWKPDGVPESSVTLPTLSYDNSDATISIDGIDWPYVTMEYQVINYVESMSKILDPQGIENKLLTYSLQEVSSINRKRVNLNVMSYNPLYSLPDTNEVINMDSASVSRITWDGEVFLDSQTYHTTPVNLFDGSTSLTYLNNRSTDLLGHSYQYIPCFNPSVYYYWDNSGTPSITTSDGYYAEIVGNNLQYSYFLNQSHTETLINRLGYSYNHIHFADHLEFYLNRTSGCSNNPVISSTNFDGYGAVYGYSSGSSCGPLCYSYSCTPYTESTNTSICHAYFALTLYPGHAYQANGEG